MTVLVLFTRDLRVRDHPALREACRLEAAVVPLFVLDPALTRLSANRTRFLLESLVDLDGSLVGLGGGLVIRHGDLVSQALSVAAAAGCTAIYITADVGAFAKARERRLASACDRARIELRVRPGSSVVDAGDVTPAGRGAYRMFTPYFSAWSGAPRRALVPAPRTVRLPPDLELGPRPDPSSVAPDAIDRPLGGERAGRRRLHKFLGSELKAYPSARDDLAADATSRLSPYLRFGCVSANEVAARAEPLDGAEPFVRQLAWRDFFAQLLADDPELAWRNLHEPVGAPAEAPGTSEAFASWRDGRTGVPLVDAAMRQLQREGWIHNRARLVAASFLTRRLGVPWQEGARHFGRLLVDGDPANNAGNWQWAAGTGTDPRRARTLNPVRQARRFDRSGAYVRRYVSELAELGAPRIFTPWKDPELMERLGYPAPIVDLPV